VPGASRDQIVGWLGEALKIRVRAQPEKGKANSSLVALLAEILKTPYKNIRVRAGQTSRAKVIEVSGMSDTELRERLGALLPERGET